MNGIWLTLAATGLLAAAGQRRGSRAVKGQVDAILAQKDVPQALRDLAEEIREEREHYGQSDNRGRSVLRKGDGFQFNVKASGAYYSVPDWVTSLRSEEAIGEEISDAARFEAEWLAESMQDSDSPLFMPWFNGEWSFAGRSSGYLVFGYDSVVEDLWNLMEEWKENTRPTISGRLRIANQDYGKELRAAIEHALSTLESRARLEQDIKEMVKGFEQQWSSEEHWKDLLDLTDEQVLAAKQGQGKRKRW